MKPTLTGGPTAGDAARHTLRDPSMRVVTPEHVSIEYPLAGMGSRFAALLVDALILMALVLGLPLVLGVTGALALVPSGLAIGVWILYGFVTLWGYFIFFEGLRDGQTPGKRVLSVRVVMEGGYPVSFEAAAIRSLIRFVDVQPFPSCLVGGFAMLVGGKTKRLGDLAAGTVVVRELPVSFPSDQEVSPGVGAPELSDEAFRALEMFVDRRGSLDATTVARLARQILDKMPTAATRLDPPDPVERLGVLYRDEAARRHAARLALRAGSPAAMQLLRTKRDRWERLREEIRRVRRTGLKSVGERQVGTFAARYRELSADLARARTYGASPETLFALERLAGAAHNLFYRPAKRTFGGVGHWISSGFPRTVRRLWLPIAVATVLLYAPGIVTFSLIRTQPALEAQLTSAEVILRAERAREPGTDYRDTWGEVWLGSTFLSSAIIANNIQVSFLAFAGGVLAGFGTAFILITNGLSLGSVLGVFANRDVLGNIGLFILPHGVIELSAITIAGGAGLWMGSAFVLPGRQRRLVALVERARDAVALVAGASVMLLVAGLIEGFVSPARVPTLLKLGWAGVAAAGLVAYLTLGGRRSRDERMH